MTNSMGQVQLAHTSFFTDFPYTINDVYVYGFSHAGTKVTKYERGDNRPQ